MNPFNYYIALRDSLVHEGDGHVLRCGVAFTNVLSYLHRPGDYEIAVRPWVGPLTCIPCIGARDADVWR